MSHGYLLHLSILLLYCHRLQGYQYMNIEFTEDLQNDVLGCTAACAWPSPIAARAIACTSGGNNNGPGDTPVITSVTGTVVIDADGTVAEVAEIGKPISTVPGPLAIEENVG
jgi:hypothetical protein